MGNSQKERCRVAVWLFTIAAMVMVMAVIGAITRLTESGLSIAEWRPIAGALPPMTVADWARVFDIYKTSPQYMLVNHGMTLAEFKNIFWWEWVHREWGRLIGFVFAGGFLYFWLRGGLKRISLSLQGEGAAKRRGRGIYFHLIAILILGLLQGVMGWWMVTSGLRHEPAVSHYRLAAHLVLAVALYVYTLALGISLDARCKIKMQDTREHAAESKFLASCFLPLFKHSIAALALVILTLIWGAFTAGLRGGLVYNTWPLMGGHLAPPDLLFLHPLWRNFFENPSAVQFTHRCLAYLASLMCVSIGLMTYIRKIPRPIARWGYAVGAMGFVQPALGIATVLSHVDLHPAVTHQAGAFVLIGLLVVWCMQLKQLNWRP